MFTRLNSTCPGCRRTIPADRDWQPDRCPWCDRPINRLTRRRLVQHAGLWTAAAAVSGYFAYDRLWTPLPDYPPGTNVSLGGRRLFPADDPWNQDVSGRSVDPASDDLIRSIGEDERLHPDFGRSRRGVLAGIPYLVVPDGTPETPVVFAYAAESDPGPYPVPTHAPVEGGATAVGDRHVLVAHWANWKLYELFDAHPQPDGSWRAGSGAVFDLAAGTRRPAGWTSADAAGLPILPGLVRYDEVYERGEITHALRFVTRRTRKAYVPPATHWASRDASPALPPMGLRLRLRADFDLADYPADAQVVLVALRRYGMLLADNGGLALGLSGTADPRWPKSLVAALKAVRGADFEAVEMTGLVAG